MAVFTLPAVRATLSSVAAKTFIRERLKSFSIRILRSPRFRSWVSLICAWAKSLLRGSDCVQALKPQKARLGTGAAVRLLITRFQNTCASLMNFQLLCLERSRNIESASLKSKHAILNRYRKHLRHERLSNVDFIAV